MIIKIQTDMSSSQYRIFSDTLQYELHKNYDIRPRENGTKKIIKVNMTKYEINTKENK
jgi:hypothetical protein